MSHLKLVGGTDVGWKAVAVSMANSTPRERVARKRRGLLTPWGWVITLVMSMLLWSATVEFFDWVLGPV